MNSEVTGRLKDATQEFKAKLPVIVELGNPAMKSRHWQKLFEVREYCCNNGVMVKRFGDGFDRMKARL